MTNDRNYVTVWEGLLDPIKTASDLQSVDKPDGFDFSEYTTELFKGYVDSDKAAEYIFKALRIEASNRFLPQLLHSAKNNKLACERLK